MQTKGFNPHISNIVVLTLLCFYTQLFAQNSGEKSPVKNEVSLEEWDKVYGSSEEIRTKDLKKYQKLRLGKNFDQRSFLDLYSSFSPPNTASTSRALKEVALLKYNFDSPLYPYKLDILDRYAQPSDRAILREHLYRYHPNNCSAKKLLADDIGGIFSSDFKREIERHRRLLLQITGLQNASMSQQMEKRYLAGMLRSQPDVIKNMRAEDFGLQYSMMHFPYVFRKKLGLDDKQAQLLFEYDLGVLGSEVCQNQETLFIKTFVTQSSNFPTEIIERRLDALFDCYKAKSTEVETEFLKRFYASALGAEPITISISAMLKLSHVYWRKDRFEEAYAVLDELERLAEKHDKPRWKYESMWMRARISENRFEYGEAVAWYEKLLKIKDQHFDVWEIRRQIVLNSIMLSRLSPDLKVKLDEYLKEWYNAEKTKDNYWFAGFINFWFGRFLENTGSKVEALRSFKRAAIESFDTFEAAVSNYILDINGEKSPLLQSLEEAKPMVSLVQSDSRVQDIDRRSLENALFFREFGISKYASCSLDRGFDEGIPDEMIRMAAQIQSANKNYLESIRLFSRLSYAERAKFGASLFRFIFPLDFKDQILTHAEKNKVEAALVFSLIRQESVFNPEAMSGAGARGLMQMTPSTARLEVNRMSADRYTHKWVKEARAKLLKESNLFDESLNIAVGIHHLGSLKAKFADNLVDTLASYNAGHMALAKWRDRNPEKDPLLFVESMPYSETRKYVKLILRNYYFYSRLHFSGTGKLHYMESVLSPLAVSNL